MEAGWGGRAVDKMDSQAIGLPRSKEGKNVPEERWCCFLCSGQQKLCGEAGRSWDDNGDAMCMLEDWADDVHEARTGS